MSRPQVSLENYQQLYDFYEGHDQNPVFARYIAHPLLAQVYRPDISIGGDGAAEDAIEQEIAQSRRLIVSPVHLTGDDQYVVVSLAQRVNALRPLRGNTFIPTEPSLSSRSGLGGKALRWAVDELGSIPIVRTEDLRRQGIEVTQEIQDMHKRAMLRAHEVEVGKLIKGNHMAGFWEGTRNRVDHTRVQVLKKGIAHTALEASQEVGVSILPVGLYYGGEPLSYKKLDVPEKRSPTVHIGMPIPVEHANGDVNLLTELVQGALQDCQDIAVKRATAR